MNPEEGMAAHDLNISVFKVERFVRSGHLLATAAFKVLAEFGWGQVGYGGNAQRGGGCCGRWDIYEGLGGEFHILQDGGRHDPL